MRQLYFFVLTTALAIGCSGGEKSDSGEQKGHDNKTNSETNSELSAADAKPLIAEAAGISNEDFEKLATSSSPSHQLVESKSLSLILFGLNPYEAADNNPDAVKDFRYLGEQFLHPSDIADAMWTSKSKGYASMIQPQYITECQCETKGNTATGTVTFAAKDLYSGSVQFSARRTDGSWQIVEFRLPNYGIKTGRDSDRTWSKSEL